MLGDWLPYFNRKKKQKNQIVLTVCFTFSGQRQASSEKIKLNDAVLPRERLLASFFEDRASKHVACNYSIRACVDQSLSLFTLERFIPLENLLVSQSQIYFINKIGRREIKTKKNSVTQFLGPIAQLGQKRKKRIIWYFIFKILTPCCLRISTLLSRLSMNVLSILTYILV